MKAKKILRRFVSKEVVDLLFFSQTKDTDARSKGKLTESLGREHLRALNAYESQLYDCPYSPRKTVAQPSAEDSMMMEEVREELATIEKERSHVLDYFGGVLSLDEDKESKD